MLLPALHGLLLMQQGSRKKPHDARSPCSAASLGVRGRLKLAQRTPARPGPRLATSSVAGKCRPRAEAPPGSGLLAVAGRLESRSARARLTAGERSPGAAKEKAGPACTQQRRGSILGAGRSVLQGECAPSRAQLPSLPGLLPQSLTAVQAGVDVEGGCNCNEQEAGESEGIHTQHHLLETSPWLLLLDGEWMK